jgi:flagellar biosynthesis protein FlhG
MTALKSAPVTDLRPAPSPLEKRLITIASGKGGVGKTWLAISLAHALSQRGRRVMLFDGDLGLANVDIQLGLTPAADVSDVLAGRRTLAQALTRYEDDSAVRIGFDILAGQSGTGALGSLGRDALLGLRSALISAAGGYDHVLLDLGAGVDQTVAMLAHHGGRCVVVITPEPTALTDAYAFIKLRRMRDPQAVVEIAVNKAETSRDGTQAYETIAKACASFLGFRPGLLGVVRRDSHVPEAIRMQLPVLARHPTCQAAGDITALAGALLKS